MYRDGKLEFFLGELAGPKAAPGGGSAAACTSAMGAALAAMVCNFTIGKKNYAGVEEEARKILLDVNEIRGRLEAAIDEDTLAYNALSAAFKSKDEAAIVEKSLGAMSVPLRVAEDSLSLLGIIGRLAEIGNKNLVTDVGCAAALAMAGLRGARMNVLINLPGLKHEEMSAVIRKDMDAALKRGAGMERGILEKVENALKKPAD
jgi:formiminotetrahydrofolate cyclodeaminase